MTDSKLWEVLQHAEDYRPEAIALAREVAKERGLSEAPVIEGADEQATLAMKHVVDIDVEPVPGWMGALFVLLPFIGGVLCLIWHLTLDKGQRDPRISQNLPRVALGVVLWLLAYYLLWSCTPSSSSRTQPGETDFSPFWGQVDNVEAAHGFTFQG